MVYRTADNNFGTAKWIVDATAGQGTHTTIAAALTSSSSGDTIFIRPGTYTENLTLVAGVNLTAFGSDGSLNNTGKVNITGKATFTGSGTVSIFGIELQTNSDYFLAVTGSSASVVNLNNCYLNCSNNTGINFTSSSSSAVINVYNCIGDIGTTGIALFSHSSSGILSFIQSTFSNTGASTTASTASAGILLYLRSSLSSPTTTSSTNLIGVQHTNIACAAQNTTALTIGGSGANNAFYSYFTAGTASAISIGSSCDVVGCTIYSSNTHAVTGAGTISMSCNSFPSSSQNVNVTTQTGQTIQGNNNGNAPSAGYIGERLEGTATSVAVTSSAAKTITSVSLTAGVWDVSVLCTTQATGGTALASALVVGISTTDNTLEGALGIQKFQINTTGSVLSGAVPAFRVTLSSTTTYYLVAFVIYSSTTSPTSGRISATRVG